MTPPAWRTLLLEPTTRPAAQLARYVVVGGVAALLDTGTFAVLDRALAGDYLAAAAAGFVVGILANYALSVRWVFAARGGPAELTGFVLIGLTGLGLTELLMWLLVGDARVTALPARLATLALVFCWNFLARRALFALRAGQRGRPAASGTLRTVRSRPATGAHPSQRAAAAPPVPDAVP